MGGELQVRRARGKRMGMLGGLQGLELERLVLGLVLVLRLRGQRVLQ